MVIWEPESLGILDLPSGRSIRGRGLRNPLPSGPLPTFGVYMTGKEPPATEWDSVWVRWRDFWLPSDPAALRSALHEVWVRSETERVEIACGGGYGRTGTALAALAIVDGVPSQDATAYVRAHYSPRAVEMPWQRRFVTRFTK
ncbi:protein phosphatase [Rhodococcus erythropolis]|uniref:protein-tyrosine phosphatase family protein n=1 Tax=Rhodococcus erythropolis TaxID=1833 RepID=UPI00294A6E80|nr:protein-tyrosine phosphatase family protein [Rhodococcus erythropolis]MDV6275455.1 protein phosphatase [Rhodococcus erythropolis]